MIVDNELNGGEGYTPVEGSEVVVKREVRKDNSSTYYYNGKKIAFKDLAQNLRQLGIDLDHNRFLILQVCPCPLTPFTWWMPGRLLFPTAAHVCAW